MAEWSHPAGESDGGRVEKVFHGNRGVSAAAVGAMSLLRLWPESTIATWHPKQWSVLLTADGNGEVGPERS